MTDIEVEEQIQQNTDLKRLIKRFNIIIAIIVVIILAGGGIIGWIIDRQVPAVSSVQIDNIRLLSPPALCPGEPVIVAYDLSTIGIGPLIRDQTLWQVTPPRVIVYSEFRRLVVNNTPDRRLIEVWRVPESYLNYETGDFEKLMPGQYRYDLSISSPSRSTAVDVEGVEFTLKERCI